MIKTLSVFGSVLLLFIASYFFYEDQQISIQPSIPQNVKPGDEFTVQLTVNKGMIAGFATLQQYLPEGFTATEIESQHAAFSFADHLVKFMWQDLPIEKSFTVSYKVKTSVTCSGLKTLNGEFSYIENDQPKKFSIVPSVIIMSDETPVASLINEELNKEIIVDKKIEPGSKGDYLITLKINRGIKNNATRVFDQLPDGYQSKLINASGSSYSVNDRFICFYWEKLPVDSSFTVSYQLISENNIHKNDFVTDNNTSEESSSECNPVVSIRNKNFGEPTSQTDQPVYVNIPSTRKGVYYKVQIAATKRSPERNNEFFRSKYKINEPVDLTMHEGWKKYLIGTFEKYADARKHRAETQANIHDAFVVAYNNGERIPLKDAMKSKKLNQ